MDTCKKTDQWKKMDMMTTFNTIAMRLTSPIVKNYDSEFRKHELIYTISYMKNKNDHKQKMWIKAFE